jgi:hypothetical protein
MTLVFIITAMVGGMGMGILFNIPMVIAMMAAIPLAIIAEAAGTTGVTIAIVIGVIVFLLLGLIFTFIMIIYTTYMQFSMTLSYLEVRKSLQLELQKPVSLIATSESN